MLFSVLSGGLGNQMFQYAFAYSFSKKMYSKFIMDLSLLKQDKKRSYALDEFNVSEMTTEFENGKWSTLNRLKHMVYGDIRDIHEKNEFQYNPEIFDLKGHLRLLGYWQCPAYFEMYRKELLEVFNLKNESSFYKQNKARLASKLSVSIHVRRGDYISESHTNAVHGTCSKTYYDQAISHFNNLLIGENINYYIFSDDKAWCKEAFSNLQNHHIVESKSDVEDLMLMASCQHNIIANSSFSWWAAWLNKNPEKEVIAPKKWFNESKIETKELIPRNWIKI